ncbi:hypothetical protein GGQ92_000703 [Gracilibacillus halotolerans]|uniref:Putative zinc-finger domain-containing protein n=1 Tax=Gracilibacillus halotolerans TaxID=74386 RepID=A0A841RKC6_9BACI|nr:zf-HC2 domain-containing protein [Gracilibacillus halotolerans]MBB6511936.1 hypothetical protein [Gracilibacillus halotolerans]
MERVNCNIIQDVLPLYVDDIVSKETKEMVDAHVIECETCRKELDMMKEKLFLPIENKSPQLQKISKQWRKKKSIVSLISVIGTAVVLIGIFSYLIYFETVIPYDEDLIQIERYGDELTTHYFGESYATFHSTHPFSLEVKGEKKNIIFIYYTKTIVDSPTRNIFNTENHQVEDEYISVLPESEKTDAVYYVDYDNKKVTSGEESWESILERAVLIWEK